MRIQIRTCYCLLPLPQSVFVSLIILFLNIHMQVEVESYHLRNSRNRDSDGVSWENLQMKLNSILEIENNEEDLLENLLQATTSTEKVEGESSQPTATSALNSELESESESELQFHINAKEVTERIVSKKRVARESSAGVVQKLMENSKRMESMVIMLADLKNVLSQAVNAQENQMALRTEVVGLREEIDYLRQEIQKMKSAQVGVEGSWNGSPKLENRIHNDEATLQWLKESVKELRHEMVEVSSSINVTGLLHMKQVWEKEEKRVNKDFQTIQTQIESLVVGQAQNSEAILEVKGDIADLRTWQAKMGEKFIHDKTLFSSAASPKDTSQTNHIETENSALDGTTKNHHHHHRTLRFENFKTDEQDENERPSRHSHSWRKLRKEMKTMDKIIMEVVDDQSLFDKRLTKLEMTRKTMIFSLEDAQIRSGSGTPNSMLSEEREENQTPFSLSQTLNQSGKSKRSLENYGASASFRLSSLERSMADYANTLEGIDSKVIALNELRNSNTQLFTALEGLESKYDERLGEMQSTMAKLEASASSISVTSGECREQQKFQSGIMQNIRKDVVNLKERSQSNSLRVASIQSQMVTWGIKTCVDESSEAIQNIKIAAIQAQLNGEAENS